CGHTCDISITACGGLGLRPGRAHREEHVGTGISVCDGEHVQPVDLVGVRNQVADGGVGPFTQARCVQRPTRLGHQSPTSHSVKGTPGWAPAYPLRRTSPGTSTGLVDSRWTAFWRSLCGPVSWSGCRGDPPPVSGGTNTDPAIPILGVLDMAAVCDICGKGPGFGKSVSHSHRRTSRR